MREIYRREKKKLCFLRFGSIIAILFLYLIKLQGHAQSSYTLYEKDNSNLILPFEGVFLLCLGFLLLLFVNDSLFFIREQGKRIYVLEKYAIVPIRKTKLYRVRIWLFLETIFYFVIGVCGIYTLVTVANGCLFSPFVFFLHTIKLLCILVMMMILIFVFMNWPQERRFQKK